MIRRETKEQNVYKIMLLNWLTGLFVDRPFIDDALDKLDWYKKIKNEIKAVLLYGSVAKGTNRIDSDIDLLIILPLEFEKKFTRGEYFYDYEGFEINIVLRSIEKLRRIDFKTDEFQKEVFRGSEIIIEGDGEVTKILTSSV